MNTNLHVFYINKISRYLKIRNSETHSFRKKIKINLRLSKNVFKLNKLKKSKLLHNLYILYIR